MDHRARSPSQGCLFCILSFVSQQHCSQFIRKYSLQLLIYTVQVIYWYWLFPPFSGNCIYICCIISGKCRTHSSTKVNVYCSNILEKSDIKQYIKHSVSLFHCHILQSHLIFSHNKFNPWHKWLFCFSVWPLVPTAAVLMPEKMQCSGASSAYLRHQYREFYCVTHH